MTKNRYTKHLKTCFKKIFEKHEDTLIFLKALLVNPRTVGAALPSSKSLAAEMAAHVPLKSQKTIVELGAGTGVITTALLERGINPKRLIVIERSATLAKKLQQNFPKVKIIKGDAKDLKSLLGKNISVIAIVSSLPLLSLPKKTTDKILKQINKLLPKNGRFIQFTYSYKEKDLQQLQRLKKVSSKRIWKNIPPARVDVFRV